IRQRPMLLLILRPQELHRIVNRVAMRRRHFALSHLEDRASFDPLLRPGLIGVGVDVGERHEAGAAVAADLVMLAAAGLREREKRVALVEREDGAVLVTAKLRAD